MGFGLFPTQRRYPIEKRTISRSRRSRFNYISRIKIEKLQKKYKQSYLVVYFFYLFHSSLKENTHRNKQIFNNKNNIFSKGQTTATIRFGSPHWRWPNVQLQTVHNMPFDLGSVRTQNTKNGKASLKYMRKVLSCHRDGHFDIFDACFFTTAL